MRAPRSFVAIGGLVTAVGSASGCGRSDFSAFDDPEALAGEGGTGGGGGTNRGGVSGVGGSTAGGTSSGGTAGTTVCPSGLWQCGNECVDLYTDSNHCGGCFVSCRPEGFCSNAGCVADCPSSTRCFGACTDLSSDPFNCGFCGNTCAPSQFCQFGACTSNCLPEQIDCGNGCTDPRRDAGNCGACGRACSIREFCDDGACTTIPDSYSYVVAPSPLTFVNACTQPGAVMALQFLDDSFVELALPFPFRFYGIQSSGAWVSSNGVLGFGRPSFEFSNDCAFGSITRSVLAFWDDLGMRQLGVCLATLGTPPNRQFVVTWNDAYILGDDFTHLTFSVVLNESSDVVDVLYGNMAGGFFARGGDATIGLVSHARADLDCCFEPCVSNNSGRRYTPVLR